MQARVSRDSGLHELIAVSPCYDFMKFVRGTLACRHVYLGTRDCMS